MPIIVNMIKVPVLPGVWWVEIPERNLRILCGTPMDSIKHLMRLGLVKKIEKDGLVFEQGPNVILLSDIPIQRGRFWNLAEFPVLHMLFRQGMGIPGHPGNTGIKPILTGLSRRAEAVLAYIYRGTYGLVSREEMREAGIAEDELEERWRLKLKFAPGGIKSPQELVDVRSIDNGDITLSDGVILCRDGENRYTFKFKGESVSVDMNLPETEDWSASYTLNNVETSAGYFSITHIGEGNGWDPERPCMGSFITYRGNKYLIDAGGGIDYSLESLGCDIAEIQGIFITHAHDDHIAGLTSLLRGDRKVNIFATRPVMATVRYKCASLLEQEPGFLDRFVNVHYLEEGRWNNLEELGGLEVRPVFSPHPLETTIMFFRALWEGGYKTYGHLADIISRKVLTGFISSAGNGALDKTDVGISEKYVKDVFSEYLRCADVKKVDIGRGMVHGFAEDFIEDPSTRLILSHTEGSLSSAELEIGASVSFGQVDILIPDRGDRLRDLAAGLLERSFPGLPRDDFNLLLNGEIQSVSPGTILLKRGSIAEVLTLIISGTVEAVEASDNRVHPSLRFSAGSLPGEEEFLTRLPAKSTYRSRNHLKVLRIPGDIYIHALSKCGKIQPRLKILETRRFLYSSSFPGSVVSIPRLDDIAAALKERVWKKNSRIRVSENELYIIREGRISSEVDKINNSDTASVGNLIYKKGDWFYLKKVEMKVLEESHVLVLDAAVVEETPVLSWTISEIMGWHPV